MDISDSQCSSGCESGWTMYLDETFSSVSRFQTTCGYVGESYRRQEAKLEKKDEEDPSMVSDASSGPRYCYDHEHDQKLYSENGYFSSAFQFTEKKDKKKKTSKGIRQQSCLADTASSQLLMSSYKVNAAAENSVMEFSDRYSSIHSEGKFLSCDPSSMLQYSLTENQASQKAGK